jgi:hypothetical protein
VKRRSTGWETVLTAPLDSLRQRLHSRGFCTPNGTSQTNRGWRNLDADQLGHLYNGMNRGRLHYDRFVDTINTFTRLQPILRCSLARPLAAKFKLSVKRVLQRFGSSIPVIVKAEDGKPERKVSFPLNADWEKKRHAFSTHERTLDVVRTARRMSTRSNLGKPCCICGSLEAVAMHQVRHIRKMGQRKITGFTAVLRALNRTQMPACQSCPKQSHRGAYDGIRLSNLAYDPR